MNELRTLDPFDDTFRSLMRPWVFEMPSNRMRPHVANLTASADGQNPLAIEHAQSTRRGSRQNQNRHQVEIPVWQHPVDLLETKLRNSS